MKQINLLPESVRKRQELRRLLALGAVGALLGTIAVGLLYLPMQLQLSTQQARVDDIKKTQAELERKALEIQQKELSANTDFSTRATQINLLSKTEIRWDKAFTLVNTLTPQDVRLTTVSYASASGVGTIRIGGTAPSNLGFAVFVESLRKNTNITTVKVESYQYSALNGAVTFSITLSVPLSSIDYSSK